MKNIILLLALGIILFGCAQPEPEGPGAVAGEELAEQTVSIKDFAFNPVEITVKQGQKVTWVNEDSVSHTVKAGDLFESPMLQKGDSYQHTFTEEPGEYPYTCGIHPSMHGMIVIVEG